MLQKLLSTVKVFPPLDVLFDDSADGADDVLVDAVLVEGAATVSV
jgi:hypothetical protein